MATTEGVTLAQSNVTLNGISDVTLASDCGDPGEVAGAYRTLYGDAWGVGASVGYDCQLNYKHSSGTLTRICLPTATWSGDPPVCGYVGAKVSLEALMAVTGTLAVLVLLLLPVEFLRYKIKQARGREILKTAKSARKAARSMARQNPFMGTPVFSRNDVLLPDSKDALRGKANYSSNSQTLPHFLPKLENHDSIPRENDAKKKTKKKRKKEYGASGGVSENKGKVSPLQMGDNTESHVAMTRNSDVTGEPHAMRDLRRDLNTSGEIASAHVRRPENTGDMYYDNHVTLEDELQQNVYSLDRHRLPALPSDRTTSISIPRPSEQRPQIELEGRDMRDFVV